MGSPGGTFAALVVAALAAGVTGGWLTYRAVRRRVGPLLRGVSAALVLLLVVVVVVEGWAHLMLDRSSVARAIVWLEADADDWRRFPAREMRAGNSAISFPDASLPDDALDSVARADGTEVELANLLQRTGTKAFIVLSRGEVVTEVYLNGSSAQATQTSFSVAKSFLSTLVGIAIERGDLGGLDDPITRYVPELLERDSRFADVTLRHLITMSSGLSYVENGTPWGDDATTYYAPDLRAAALSVTIDGPPGGQWHYNNYNPLLVGLALERATGEPVADYMEHVLWQPMGALADGSWSLDSRASGFEKMESGVNARAMDFARFGYLIAHDGSVHGRQVVPARWVREATSQDVSSDPAAHYQYWWWVDTERQGRFFARGNHGQYIYVAPDVDVVAVRMGTRAGIEDWPLVLRDVVDQVAAVHP